MQKFDPLKKYSFRKARDWKYPLWCSLAVNAYLDWLRRSFHSEGTIRSYKYVVYNFCGVERVIDALGNRDSTTVNVYLTYDELHMRKCALSLKEMSIPMGGATK